MQYLVRAMPGKYFVLITCLLLSSQAFAEPLRALHPSQGGNQLIDFNEFLSDAKKAYEYRQDRRLSEEQFLEMSKDPNTIILDTRSARAFEQLHVKGARHLNFSDITKVSLQEVIPSKETRILIYCNNNFSNSPSAFPSKLPEAALNIPTFINLYSYGYKNIYEFGPLVDPSKSKLAFEGSLAD